jgi:signal transduction histidine kinase
MIGAYPERSDLFRDGALASLLRLQWFIRMRWCMVGVALGALAIERFVVPEARRPTGLIVVVVGTGLVNLVWTLVSHWVSRDLHVGLIGHGQTMRAAQRFANAQVSVDLLLLTLILRYAGGVESVLAVFYLFHMGIGSLLLEPAKALLQGVWAVVLYAGLGVGELIGWIAPHYEFLPYLPSSGWYQAAGYVLVAALVQLAAVFGTLYFTLRIARRFGEQEGHLRRALASLRSSRQAIKELQARRSRFMSTAAHQLKSPLTAIETMAGLIRDGYVRDGAAQQTIERIIRRCHDAVAGVGDLLTLARVQQADPHRHGTARADVVEVVRKACAPREAEARHKGLSFTLELPEVEDLRARIDPTDLNDCVDNLLENAIKYTPGPGRVVVSVRTCTSRSAPPFASGGADGLPCCGNGEATAMIEIEVTDTGIGIAEVDLGGADARSARCPIFDPYRRGNAALEAGISGSGLGLSIVREVVEQAGGDVSVRSQVGTGSTFTVRLPAVGATALEMESKGGVAEPSVDGVAGPAPVEEGANPAASGSGPRVKGEDKLPSSIFEF